MRAVSLIFPPLTEATLFPYLSLPVLAAALEAGGIQVRQADANIDLISRLLEPQALGELLNAQEQGGGLRSEIRKALIRFVMSAPDLWYEATKKASQSDDQARAIRSVKRIFDLAIESSVLDRIGLSISGALSILEEASGEDDLLLKLMEKWVTKHLEDLPPGTVLGLSIPFFSQIVPTLWICRCARALRSDLIIVLGGPQVWLHFKELEGEIRAHKLADALCFGEGDAAIVAIAKLEEQSQESLDIPNVRWIRDFVTCTERPSFKDQVPTDINASPPPVFECSLLGEYLISEIQFPLLTCVGCYWGRCSFCSYGNRYHAASLYRELRPERLEAHCVHLIERYGAKRINFVDENCNLKLVARAMRRVLNRGYRVRFSVRNRLDKALASRNFCEELALLGCELMSVGYETNSQRLLDLMDRGLNAKMFEPILRNLRDVGINVRLSVMGAMPQESEQELTDSMAFLDRVASYVGIDSAQKLVAEPMTYMVEAPLRYGANHLEANLTDCNRELAFGLGRAGCKFASTSRITESDFSTAVRAIHPMGNDEQRPTLDLDINPDERIDAIRLLPHIFAARYGEHHLIIGDLSWQDFYKVPANVLKWNGGSGIVASAPSGELLLSQFVRAGMAKPIEIAYE